MARIEITIGEESYLLSGEETPEHLNEVAELVKRRVESIRKKSPRMNLQKATMLTAFDFASQVIKGSKKSTDYRSAILTKAKLLLERVDLELAARSPRSES